MLAKLQIAFLDILILPCLFYRCANKAFGYIVFTFTNQAIEVWEGGPCNMQNYVYIEVFLGLNVVIIRFYMIDFQGFEHFDSLI